MSKKVKLRKIDDPPPPTDNKVFLVQGGCWGDEHVIAVYNNEPAAIGRAEKENKECKGLEVYVEPWDILSRTQMGPGKYPELFFMRPPPVPEAAPGVPGE